MLKKIFFVVAIFSFFLFFSVDVFAQEKAGFSVSPPSFELSAKPGDVLKNTIRIENLSSADIHLRVRPQSFTAYGEGGQVALNEEDTNFSIIKWLKFENDELTIKAKEAGFFNFILEIPLSAEPGSHYGAVVFSTVPSGNLSSSGATVSQEIGSLILVKIPGNVYENVKLLSFLPSSKYIKNSNVVLRALLQNDGSVHVKPYGFIVVNNVFGQKIKTIEVVGRNILPGSKRIFEENFKINGFGLYFAELTLLYSGGGRLLRGKTSFFILNLEKSLQFMIVGVVLMLFIVLFRKRFFKAIKILLKG